MRLGSRRTDSMAKMLLYHHRRVVRHKPVRACGTESKAAVSTISAKDEDTYLALSGALSQSLGMSQSASPGVTQVRSEPVTTLLPNSRSAAASAVA